MHFIETKPVEIQLDNRFQGERQVYANIKRLDLYKYYIDLVIKACLLANKAMDREELKRTIGYASFSNFLWLCNKYKIEFTTNVNIVLRDLYYIVSGQRDTGIDLAIFLHNSINKDLYASKPKYPFTLDNIRQFDLVHEIDMLEKLGNEDVLIYLSIFLKDFINSAK